jgi:predicted nucleic acid-binding protein
MSGRTKFVLDTNAVIAVIKGQALSAERIEDLRHSKNCVSVITRIELFAYPNLTEGEAEKIRCFLKKCRVVPLKRSVELLAIKIRRDSNPRLKLPDSIIAATALILNATLLTNDIKLFNKTYSGLKSAKL